MLLGFLICLWPTVMGIFIFKGASENLRRRLSPTELT
jgi:hypothetical protein